MGFFTMLLARRKHRYGILVSLPRKLFVPIGKPSLPLTVLLLNWVYNFCRWKSAVS